MCETVPFLLLFRISRIKKGNWVCAVDPKAAEVLYLPKNKMRNEDQPVLLHRVRDWTFVKLALITQCLLSANNALKKNKGDRNVQTKILSWKAEIRPFPQ